MPPRIVTRLARLCPDQYDWDVRNDPEPKVRKTAILDLHRTGNKIEDIKRLSRASWAFLMAVLGTEAVVYDLYRDGWSFGDIAESLGLPLGDVARHVGGRTRSGKHRYAVEEEEDEAEEELKPLRMAAPVNDELARAVAKLRSREAI